LPGDVTDENFIGEIKMGSIVKRTPIVVRGKTYLYTGDVIEFESMIDAGFVLITSIGSENLYFKFIAADGNLYDGYCKCL
jgi:hypothetical protein